MKQNGVLRQKENKNKKIKLKLNLPCGWAEMSEN